MTNYDFDSLEQRVTYRSMGTRQSRERIGAGLMHKPGIKGDNENFRFPNYALVYVLRGKGEFVDANGNRYALAAGDYFQRFPMLVHSNYIDPDSNWCECFVDLGPQLCEALESMRILRREAPVGHVGLSDSMIKAFLDLELAIRDADEDELPKLTLQVLELALMLLGSGRQNRATPALSELVELACQQASHDFSRKFSVQNFCQLHGIGYETFRKAFRNQVGISPDQYRVRRRLDAACQLLGTGELSVSETAAELGFSSPYEFSNHFKRHLGVSPSEYRSRTESVSR